MHMLMNTLYALKTMFCKILNTRWKIVEILPQVAFGSRWLEQEPARGAPPVPPRNDRAGNGLGHVTGTEGIKLAADWFVLGGETRTHHRWQIPRLGVIVVIVRVIMRVSWHHDRTRCWLQTVRTMQRLRQEKNAEKNAHGNCSEFFD